MNAWDLPTTGNLSFDDYRRSMDAWLKAHPYTGQEAYDSRGIQDLVSGGIDSVDNINQDRNAWERKQLEAFSKNLTPAQIAQYKQLGQARNEKLRRNGQLAALGSFGAVAGAGLLGSGLLGGGAGGAAAGATGAEGFGGSGVLDMFGGGFGSGLPASVGNLPTGMLGSESFGGLGALGSAGSGALTGGSDVLDMFGGGFGSGLPPEVGNLPGGMFGSELGSLPGLGSIGGALTGGSDVLDMFGGGFGSGLPPEVGNLPGGMFGSELGSLPGLGSIGGAIGGAGGITDLIKKYGPDVVDAIFGSGSGSGINLGGLLGNLGLAGAGILNNYYNNSRMPDVPDYMKLANMNAVSANPNQTNAQGDTSTWTIDPVTGKRTQQVKYGAQNQAAYDQQQAMMAALRKQAATPTAAPPLIQDPTNLQQVNPNNLWG